MPQKSKRRAAVPPIIILLLASLLTGGAMLAIDSFDWIDGMAMMGSAHSSSAASGSNAPSGGASSGAASGSAASDPSGAMSTDGLAVLGSEAVASASTDDNRATNLSMAAQALDGIVIEPGKTLSLNTVLNEVGKSSFAVASESADGHTEAVRGGGVCQLASALYIAAARADLEIVERHAHEEPCDYVAIGLDAEVNFANRDLKIRNTGSDPVVVRATAQGQTVKVELYGTPREDGVTYDIVATVVEDSGSNGEGAGDEAAKIETRQVRYENGVKVSDKVLFVDTYRVNATPYVMGSGAVGVPK